MGFHNELHHDEPSSFFFGFCFDLEMDGVVCFWGRGSCWPPNSLVTLSQRLFLGSEGVEEYRLRAGAVDLDEAWAVLCDCPDPSEPIHGNQPACAEWANKHATARAPQTPAIAP